MNFEKVYCGLTLHQIHRSGSLSPLSCSDMSQEKIGFLEPKSAGFFAPGSYMTSKSKHATLLLCHATRIGRDLEWLE